MGRAHHLGLLAALTGLGSLAAPAVALAHDSPGWLAFCLVAVTGLAGAALIYAPGLALARAIGPAAEGLTGVILRATVLTVVGLPLILGLTDRVLAAPLTGAGLALALGLATLPGLLLVWSRAPAPIPHWRGDVLAMGLVPLGLLALLFPKFLWESLNGDGAHVFETMRYMIVHGVPFWSGALTDFASYPTSIWMEVVAGAPFVRLFGEVPVAARLPVLAGLGLLTGVVLGLIRHARAAPPDGWQIAGVGAALVLYAATLGWQASYNPYFADVALPLAREPLAMVVVLGFVWSFLHAHRPGMAVFVFLGMFTLPSMPVLIALWLGAVFLVWRPIPWARLVWAAVMAALGVLVAAVLLVGLVSAGLLMPSGEFGPKSLLTRLRFVSVFEIERLAFLAVPCGLIPAAGLLAWFWQDRLGRSLALMALGYGAFFYVQAYRVLPHHFAPAAILALIVFWRLAPAVRWPRPAAALAFVGVLAGLWLARPADWRPHLETAAFGSRIVFEDSAYGRADPRELEVIHDLMGTAFPADYTEQGPATRFIGSPLAWYSHAMAPKPAGTPVDYRIRAGRAGPDEHLLAEAGEHVLVVTDPAIHAADRDRTDVVRSLNDLFYVPRRVLFGNGSRDGPRPVWDLAEIVGIYRP